MCIIIDTNRIAEVVSRSDDAMPVLEWLKRPSSHIAVGGTKLAVEYKKVASFLSLITTLDRAGRVRRYDGARVDREEAALLEAGSLRSDDPHIIALAKVSGARLLYSDDRALHCDFTDRAVLAPKGRVYQYAAHVALLRRAPTCGAA